MSLTTKIIVALSLGVFLLAIGVAYTLGHASITEKELNAIIDAGAAAIKAKDEQIAAQATANLQLAEDVKQARADVAVLREDVKKIKAESAAEKKKYETAPPESLVQTARQQLDSKDIVLNGIKIEFGLVPFRTAVIRLGEWEDFTLKLIPKYEETFVGYEKTVERMAVENGGLKTEILLLKERISSTDQIVTGIKDFIIARDRVTFWSWLKDTGIKVGLGYGFGRLTK